MQIRSLRLSLLDVIVSIPIFIFIGVMVYTMINEWNHVLDFYNIRVNLIDLLQIKYYSNNFIFHTLACIALLGIFIKGYFGWFSITTLFYFQISNWINFFMPNETNKVLYLVVLFPLTFVIIANLRLFRKKYVRLNDPIVTLNTIPIIIALILTYIKGYIYFNLMKNMHEILEIIK